MVRCAYECDVPMNVTITQFRKEIFELVNQALHGDEVWVTYKGNRFRITPEIKPGGRLSQITPLEVINPDLSITDNSSLQEEMERAWEDDWATL